MIYFYLTDVEIAQMFDGKSVKEAEEHSFECAG